jgi:hypothetical protein
MANLQRAHDSNLTLPVGGSGERLLDCSKRATRIGEVRQRTGAPHSFYSSPNREMTLVIVLSWHRLSSPDRQAAPRGRQSIRPLGLIATGRAFHFAGDFFPGRWHGGQNAPHTSFHSSNCHNVDVRHNPPKSTSGSTSDPSWTRMVPCTPWRPATNSSKVLQRFRRAPHNYPNARAEGL